MGMFRRMKQILSANMNAALNKLEDPEKMIDQYIQDAVTTLGEAKAKTADAMVIAERCKKRVRDCESRIEELNACAEKAVIKGFEEDAAKLIEKRLELEKELEDLTSASKVAEDNLLKMKELHDQLVKELDTYKSKRDSIRSKMAVVKTSEKVSELTRLVGKSNDSLGDFSRMEEKVNDMLAKQNALAQLEMPTDEISSLKNKYHASTNDEKVKEEIQKLKAKCMVEKTETEERESK